jgi:hypothetical protein
VTFSLYKQQKIMDLSELLGYNQETEQNAMGEVRLCVTKRRLDVQEHYLKANVFPKWC